jgi:hypothetical protein
MNKDACMLLLCLTLLTFACNIKNKIADTGKEKIKIKFQAKPGSSFSDTLKTVGPVAVFYQPDSLQLEKIKAVTDERVFKGSMHEYFYQQRNAHVYLKKNWPHLLIVDVKDIRFLLFLKAGKNSEVIDLDKMNDACGLIVFDRRKSPLTLDMTNVETQVTDYFKEN